MISIGDELTINGITGNFIRWKVQDKIAILFDGSKNHEVELPKGPIPEKPKSNKKRCRACSKNLPLDNYREYGGKLNKTCNECLTGFKRATMRTKSVKQEEVKKVAKEEDVELEGILKQVLPQYADGYLGYKMATVIEKLLSGGSNAKETIEEAYEGLAECREYIREGN